jgi:hypothetical protein
MSLVTPTKEVKCKKHKVCPKNRYICDVCGKELTREQNRAVVFGTLQHWKPLLSELNGIRCKCLNCVVGVGVCDKDVYYNAAVKAKGIIMEKSGLIGWKIQCALTAIIHTDQWGDDAKYDDVPTSDCIINAIQEDFVYGSQIAQLTQGVDQDGEEEDEEDDDEETVYNPLEEDVYMTI